MLKESAGLLYHLFHEEEEPEIKVKSIEIQNLSEEKAGIKVLVESAGYSVRAKTHSFGFESRESIADLKPSLSFPLTKTISAGEYFFISIQVLLHLSKLQNDLFHSFLLDNSWQGLG